jgi:plasmid stability protein
MANLQIKNIDDRLYQQIKLMAGNENRSVSQQVLFLIRNHLSQAGRLRSGKNAAQVLLDLAGSWEDPRTAAQIVSELKAARKKSRKLSKGL